MKVLKKKKKKSSAHRCQRNSEWGGATSSWRDQERVFQELKDVLNSYGKWLVGIILKFPGLNHFHFLPPNRVSRGEDTCSVWSDDAPLWERAPCSSFQQKAVRRSNVDTENNSVFVFNSRTNTVTLWRKTDRYYKNGLMKGKFNLTAVSSKTAKPSI